MSAFLSLVVLLSVPDATPGPSPAAKRSPHPDRIVLDRPAAFLAQQLGPARQPRRGAQPRGAGVAPSTPASNPAGADMVGLIETVIAPKSWESMGGPGTIRLWPPARGSVNRAPVSVHDRMADLADMIEHVAR
jgi:hypothetical protein